MSGDRNAEVGPIETTSGAHHVRATIRVMQKGSPIRPQFAFSVVDETGKTWKQSNEFSSGFRKLVNSRKERKYLSTFLAELRGSGWEVIRDPVKEYGDDWYAYQLARGVTSQGQGEIARAVLSGQGFGSSPVATRGGAPIAKLWTITLIIIVGLFVVCVLLVLSAQIEFRPA